jgi:prepilin-type N-terminal cleavage/methylation domain-containing protein
MAKTLPRNSGFTIIELIVATTVLSLMIVALVNLVIGIAGIQRQNDRLQLATRAAETKIESLRNAHYNSLAISPPAIDFASELPADLPSPRTATVTVSEPSPGLKRLDVNVTYREGSKDKTVQLTSLIGNIGISQ